MVDVNIYLVANNKSEWENNRKNGAIHEDLFDDF